MTTAQASIKTHNIECWINAPVQNCFEAWTDDNLLGEWAGNARVGSAPGDDYCLSSSLPYLSGRHQIIAIDPNKSLQLKHYIDGWPSDLKVTFAEKDGGTKIVLVFSVDTKNAPTSIEPLHLADHFFYFIGQSWQVALKNLRSLLEDGSIGVILPRENNDHVINFRVDIHAPPEKIWEVLTTAELLTSSAEGLVLEGAEIEPKLGGIYSYGWYPKDTPESQLEDGPSKIVEFQSNEKLAIKWHGGQKPSTVTYRLEKLPDGITRVHFKHGQLLGHSSDYVWSYRNGWTEHLYQLKWFIERGETEDTYFRTK